MALAFSSAKAMANYPTAVVDSSAVLRLPGTEHTGSGSYVAFDGQAMAIHGGRRARPDGHRLWEARRRQPPRQWKCHSGAAPPIARRPGNGLDRDQLDLEIPAPDRDISAEAGCLGPVRPLVPCTCTGRGVELASWPWHQRYLRVLGSQCMEQLQNKV